MLGKVLVSPILELPGPVRSVWVMSKEILEQEKTVWNAVPEAIVALVLCKCKKGWKMNVCSCKKAGLTCTNACICNEAQECENQNDYCYDSSDDEE